MILDLLPSRAASVGSPGGLHPRAPTERSVTVSRHSALLISIQRRRGPTPVCKRVGVSIDDPEPPHQRGDHNTFPARPDLPTRFLPDGVRRPVARANKPRDEPAPSLHPHYRGFGATTSRSASRRRDGTQRLRLPPSTRSLSPPADALANQRAGSIGTGLPTFRAGAADRAHATYTPDTTWPILGHPPGSSRELLAFPVSMSSTCFDASSAVRSRSPSRSPPDTSPGAFSASLTTTVFSQRSMRRFDASPRRATPKGHNLHHLHSTASNESAIATPSLRSWRTQDHD
jgi:hypothetical protein